MSRLPFEIVVERHGALVMRFLIARLGPADAEDAFQDTMLLALRGYDGLRSPDAARAWLLRIAQRVAHDSGRARRGRPVPVADVPDSSESGPEDRTDIWGRVRHLPDKQRTAVVLRFALDLPYRQIGEVMETSTEAARANVHAALSRLRRDGGAP